MRKENSNKKDWSVTYKDRGQFDCTTEADWIKEKSIYLDALKAISKELEMQKKVSLNLQKRLIMLENKKEKKSPAEYNKGFHRKTNSDVHKYVEPQRKPIAKLQQKPKGSLEDYVAKRTQYKLKRAKKGQGSSYGGFGSDIVLHGSSGGTTQLPQKGFLAATIDVKPGTNFVVSNISMKRGSVASPNTPAKSKPTVGGLTSKEIRFSAQDPFLFSISEDNSGLFSTIECANKSGNITALHLEGEDNESESSLNERDFPQPVPQFVNPKRKHQTTGINSPRVAPAHKLIKDTAKLNVSAHLESPELFHEKCVLRSHMDVIRDVQFSSNLNYLVTVSEDCMVKLWDIKGLKKNNLPHPVRIEPCFSYRGHTGPLFTTCAGSGLQQHDHFLYTAGSEGIIRIWGIPSIDGSKYPLTDGKNYCVGLWTSHRDVVWQLVHHPSEDLLLSVSADGTVKMWKEFDISELIDSVDKNSNDCLLGAFVYKSKSQQYYEIPTSGAWVSNGGLLISYGKNKGVIRIETNPYLRHTEQQVNRVITHPANTLAFTGHENGFVRVFDAASLKQVKAFNGHSDSITTILLPNTGPYLMTGGCDGIVKTWDIRKYQCVTEFQAHKKKYREGVCSLAMHKQMPFIATAGADATAKIYTITT